MNNYENNHHDGITPIEPVFENSLEANLNNDNISEQQVDEIASKTMQIVKTEDNNDKVDNSFINENLTENQPLNEHLKDNIVTSDNINLLKNTDDNLKNDIISVSNYLKYIIIFNIPIINIIMIIRLMNENDNNNINNLAKAYLILLVISSIFLIIIKIIY